MPSQPSPPVSSSLGGTFLLAGERPVQRLGFGAMRITGKGIWGPPADKAEAIAVLRRAVALGINLIDTAESYGPAVSEDLIAEALYPYPSSLVIATKGGLDRTGPDQWPMNAHPDRLRQAVDGSLRRLKLQQIDLYQLHRIDPAVPEADQLGTLQELQRQGKIRHVGLSEVTVAQIQRARRFFPVVSVQNRYNLADRTWEDVLDYCDREQIAFIAWSPLQIGAAGRSRTLRRIAARHGATEPQVALAWLLRRSPVMLPIPGTAQVRHLEENCEAGGVTLSDAEFDELGEARPTSVIGRGLSRVGRGLGRLFDRG